MGPQVLDDFLHYHCILHLFGRPFLSGIHVFLDTITAIGVRFKVGVLLSPALNGATEWARYLRDSKRTYEEEGARVKTFTIRSMASLFGVDG